MPQGANIAQLLPALRSEKWQERAGAAKQIVASEAAVRDPLVRGSLLNLLERENAFRDRLAREYLRTGKISLDNPGEAFSEYYHEVLAKVAFDITDLKSSRDLRVLANSWYLSWSQWAKRLAGVGESIVPIAIELARSDLHDKRDNGLSILAIAAEKRGLSRAAFETSRQAILNGLKDDNVPVRWTAIKGLGVVGSPSDIRTLQQIARTDPAVDEKTTRQELRFPLRTEALKSIAAIEQRNR